MNPYPITSDESMRYHAQELSRQKLDELQDMLGRYNRHQEASAVREIMREIQMKQVTEMQAWIEVHGPIE